LGFRTPAISLSLARLIICRSSLCTAATNVVASRNNDPEGHA
jgi:hypothetical protein